MKFVMFEINKISSVWMCTCVSIIFWGIEIKFIDYVAVTVPDYQLYLSLEFAGSVNVLFSRNRHYR